MRARAALRLTQKQMGDALNATQRTIARWEATGPRHDPGFAYLAQRVFAADPELAAHLAQAGGTTLAALGLATRSGDVAASRVNASVQVAHLADSVVCAAAEAASTTPQVVRPALAAALARAAALGLDMTTLRAALGVNEKP